MYAIFDGHTGPYLANYLAQTLPYELFNHPLYKTHPRKAISQVFENMNQSILEKLRSLEMDVGSTALIVIVQNKSILIINLGDAQCALVETHKDSGARELKFLNSQHRTSNIAECERIEQMGGWILNKKGVPRVSGQLQITRAFGDQFYQPFISCEPEVTILKRKCLSKDACLILATDGLWDVIF